MISSKIIGERVKQYLLQQNLSQEALAGLVVDSLPDSFGNAILDQWLTNQANRTGGITPLERLKYTGLRGMGALEFHPRQRIKGFGAIQNIELATLTKVA